MRIISGLLRGRQFDAPKGHRTHPMGDKIRGALFAALGDIEGLTLLDGFGGSGAISFEAISRGSKSVVCIEADKYAHHTIDTNAKILDINSYIKIIRANSSSWSDNNRDVKFDLVILDPPYEAINTEQLTKLAFHSKNGGIVVLSLPPNSGVRLSDREFVLLKTKRYGDATLDFYRRNP